MVNTKVDLMILGVFRPSVEVAAYKLARALANVVVRFSDPFFSAIFADFSRLYTEGGTDACRALIKRCTAAIARLMLCLAIPITLFANVVPTLISGKAYADAGPLLAIGIWGFAIGAVFFWTWPAAVGIGRPDFGTKTGIFVIAVQLSLALFLVQRYGALGNMLSLVAAYVVGQPVLAFLVLREFKKGRTQSKSVYARASSATL
jgi:O-antigen/teichoic acid export membrane protein